MRDNMTLGEMKAHCAKMTADYGADCCQNCEFNTTGCCKTPENWDLQAGCCKAQPNWEEMFKASEETCRQLYLKAENLEQRASYLVEENERLKLVLRTVETMIGRKFDV